MLASAIDSRPTAPPGAGATSASPAGQGASPGLLSWFTSLPGVSQAIHAITTYNIGPVTELLNQAAFFPLLISTGGGVAGVAQECAARRFAIAAEMAPLAGRVVGRNLVGGPAAFVRFRFRVVPDDYVGNPRQVRPLPAIPLVPHLRQRIEVFDWVLRFRDGPSGYRAYGTGHTLPGAGAGQAAPGTVGVGFVLDVLEGFGELAGLAGTVVASGTLTAAGAFEVAAVTRIVDPDGGLLTKAPLPPVLAAVGGADAAPGVTYLAVFGQVDPAHPTTLRLSLTEGFLGSEVYERMRVASLDFATGPPHPAGPAGGPAHPAGTGGGLRSRGVPGVVAGSVSARLSFDPVSLCPTLPIQTRYGVFEFQDLAGRSLGSIRSDMTEGRAFPTSMPGMLLPIYRFGGFGPIAGGSGEFAGARGIMTLNAEISVQPRTLSNLYVLRLDDPDGRYRAAGSAAAGAVAVATGPPAEEA